MEWSIFHRRSREILLCLIGIYHFVNSVGALAIIGQPRSQAVQEGSTLILECIIESTNQPYVIWYKKEGPGSNVPLSSHRVIRTDAPERDRLSIVGRPDNNAYNLRIRDVNSSDDSKYQCMAHIRGASVRSVVARVVVLPFGESVACQLYPQHASVGTILNYTCRAPLSMPTATLSWWHGNVRIYNVDTLPEGGLRLHYVVTPNDNYIQFTCIVGNNLNAAYGLNCSTVPMSLPLTGRLDPEFNRVTIGSHAAFRCSAEATPAVNRIKWLVGYGTAAKISKTGGRFEIKNDPRDAGVSTLIIKNISVSDNGTDVRCVLMNAIRQKDIVTAHVVVGGSLQTELRTTRRPRVTLPRTNPPITQIPIAPIIPTRRTKSKTTLSPTNGHVTAKLPSKNPVTTRLQPRMKDVEISVHDTTAKIGDFIPVIVDTGVEIGVTDTGDTSTSSQSTLIPTIASLCALFIVFIVAGVIIYMVVFRRKVINKSTIEVRYRPSQSANGAELTIEERAAARMSLRLQTIEVVVNQPPAEWQSRLKDVKPVENEYTNFAPGPINELSSTPPPAYSANPMDMEITPSPRTSQHSSVEDPEEGGGAIYAMPAKKPSNNKRDANTDNNNKDTRQVAKRQVSDARKRLLSQDFEDEDIEWDQSSWDTSSFEDELETVERIQGGQMYSGPADTVYANTSTLTRAGEPARRDSYGPTYGNLPSHLKDGLQDPAYSRVASLTKM